jgi:HEAT repeat protein
MFLRERFSQRGPGYDGHPVSYWFRELCHTDSDNGPSTAATAFQKMGTNAVPYLLEQAFDTNEDSKGFLIINDLLRALNLPRSVTSRERLDHAGPALDLIKPPAHQLLDLMHRQLNSTNLFERHQSLYILGSVGEDAEQVLPELEMALKETNRGTRAVTLQSLGRIGPRAGVAVPAMLEVIKDPRDPNYWGVTVAVNLGKIGSNAAPALPEVRELFERETSWNTKGVLAVALLRIDPGQTYALDFLRNCLNNPAPAMDQGIAVWFFGEVGPTAKAAVPDLLNALAGTNEGLVYRIPAALKKIGADSETVVPRLKLSLQSKDDSICVAAASGIFSFNPADHETHLALMKLIKNGSPSRRSAIVALEGAGPAAAEAIPVLREAAKNDPDRIVKFQARHTLKVLESKPIHPE